MASTSPFIILAPPKTEYKHNMNDMTVKILHYQSPEVETVTIGSASIVCQSGGINPMIVDEDESNQFN